MSAKIIDGEAAAARLRAHVAADAAEILAETGVKPGLAVVLIGDDPASRTYVAAKAKRAEAVGVASTTHRLPAETTQSALLDLVARLNADPAVHGVLVQLPLPAQIEAAAVIEAIDPDKDVDGFHPMNAGRLATGRPALIPCTPLGCLMLLQDHGAALDGAEAVVVGRSNIVGKPMAQLLLGANATVTLAHSRTTDLPEVCRRADLLIAAVGRPEMIRGDWIKDGATVIDVGINRVAAPEKGLKADGAPKTRLVGDVAFDEAAARAGAITPVPGGVGPMTIACLLANATIAARASLGLPSPEC